MNFLHYKKSLNILQLLTLSLPLQNFGSVLLLIVSSLPLPACGPPGRLSRGRRLDPLPESSGLAPLQEHLPGVVCHGARGRPVQRCRHGPVRLRHPALRLRVLGREGRRRRERE